MPYKPEGFEKLLAEKGIPVHTWRTGSLGRLKEEINSGKCTFSFDSPMRLIFLVGVVVFHKQLVLVEKQREFENGQIEVRTLKASISRELDSGEKPEMGAERTLCEALKIENGPPKPIFKGLHGVERKSKVSYPGLQTKYVMYIFETSLPEEFFNPKGYIDQNGHDTFGEKKYLIWKKAGGAQ